MSGDNEIGCTVLIDGEAISDGYSLDPDVPAVLSGLRVRWGRSSTVDQPPASTCTFTVLDPLDGQRLVPSLTIGRRIDVQVDTVIYPDPTYSTIPNLIPSAVSSAAAVTVAADGKSAAMIADASGRTLGFYLPPLPFTSNPLGWDAVPRTLPGQAWRYTLTITVPAPFAGYSAWRAEVAPAYFTKPDGSDVSAPGPWTVAAPTADVTFTPPAGVWLGLAVHLYPVGPAWDDLDATPWDGLTGGVIGPGDPAALKVTAFGDSITAGTWLPQYSDSWIAKLEARLGVPITNRAVGGVPLHDPSGGGILMDQITAALANGQPAFTHAVILCGTNDLMTHDTNTISQSITAAQAVQDALVAAGVRVIWLTVLPMGYGTSHRDADVPTLLTRMKILNDALRGIAGTRHYYETGPLFGADPFGFVLDSATWLIDGLHPNATGASQMANLFPLELLNAAWSGYHPTWDELATFKVSGLQMLAPLAGVAQSAYVFSGRITDVITAWDGSDTAEVQVIAQDWLAELANRFVGDTPWGQETLGERAQRIVSLSGQPVTLSTDAGVAGLQVTYRDVDRQAAEALLQQLATSCGGILWTATHLVTGQVMRIEDVNARPAALTLSDVGTGLVHIVPSAAAIANALPITACDIDADPVRFILDMTDTISMVAVQWLEQTVDPGPPAVTKPTQRSVEVIAPNTMAVIGSRRLSISTQLVTLGDANTQATSWLARRSTLAWRIENLRWDSTGDLSPIAIHALLTLLDGTARNGLPIALTDLPAWAGPMTHGQSEVALYVEGGTYSYSAGSWVLELDTSSATGSASGDLPWQNLDAGWSWDEFDPDVAWLDLYGVTYPVT